MNLSCAVSTVHASADMFLFLVSAARVSRRAWLRCVLTSPYSQVFTPTRVFTHPRAYTYTHARVYTVCGVPRHTAPAGRLTPSAAGSRLFGSDGTPPPPTSPQRHLTAADTHRLAPPTLWPRHPVPRTPGAPDRWRLGIAVRWIGAEAKTLP